MLSVLVLQSGTQPFIFMGVKHVLVVDAQAAKIIKKNR